MKTLSKAKAMMNIETFNKNPQTMS